MNAVDFARGWRLDVDRGPDWLFVRVERPEASADSEPPLAECLWDLLRQHFVNRLVLELDELEVLPSYLIGQLVLFHKRLHTQGGILRLCGLSAANQRVLEITRLGSRFPVYATRTDAVMGYRPTQPR